MRRAVPGTITLLILLLALTAQPCWAFAASRPAAPTGARHESAPLLLEVTAKVKASLARMDRQLAAAAGKLSRTGIDRPASREILKSLLAVPHAVDSCTIDPRGRMVLVEPEQYKTSEGADLSGQKQIERLHRTKQPVMSSVIRMVEGFDGVDLEYPVISRTGGLAGSVSLVFKPDTLIGDIAGPAVKGYPVEIWAMETDGRVIYDGDPGEIGKNLFTDDMYKPFEELRALARRISAEPTGTGNYSFYQEGIRKVIQKRAAWSTVGLHGTQWRIVMVQKASRDNAAGEVKTISVPSLEKITRALADDPRLAEALSSDDEAAVLGLFREFYGRHRGLYSVQWVDAAGVGRFGHPAENSVRNFDFRNRPKEDGRFLAVIDSGKAATLELRLGEGGRGTVRMEPVHLDGKYLGMVYTIVKKARR